MRSSYGAEPEIQSRSPHLEPPPPARDGNERGGARRGPRAPAKSRSRPLAKAGSRSRRVREFSPEGSALRRDLSVSAAAPDFDRGHDRDREMTRG
jgi:hypothetical protein